MPDKLKVFISTVSSQFKECRDELASDLRAIGCEVKVQEDFQQGPDTLIAQIESYVDQCDRVIAVVGTAYGCEAAKLAVPETDPPRSYTQWEYYFALGERLNGTQAPQKERFVYFASDSYLNSHPVTESDELAERQRLFLQMVQDSGKHWGEFGSKDELCRLVLRDGWRIQERPHKPNNLPYLSLENLFKGREEFIDSLHRHLQESKEKAAAIVAKQAIHGLGGIGKTRLAVEYAWRFQSEYSGIVFVRAESQSTLEANLAALCEPGALNLQEQAAKEQEVRVAAALRWFADYSGWLLILDNVDSKDAAEAVEDLLSRLQQGHVLITSRISDWSGHIDTRELDVLDEPAAVEFILERTRGKRVQKDTDEADALSLAREMGCLALALEQAGAFIAQKRISIADYLIRWRKQEEKVRTWYDKRLMNYPYSVAVTWNTSFNQLDAQAKALLNLLCWFSPEPIPRALLKIPAGEQQLAEILDLTGPIDSSIPVVDLENAITTLAGYSLVKWEDDNKAFSLHRLVADITRSHIERAYLSLWLTAVFNWLNAYFPDEPPPQDMQSWNYWQPMRSHLFTILKAANSLNIHEPCVYLLIRFGTYLFTQGEWRKAEFLMRHAISIDEAIYGKEHPKLIAELNNLAAILQSTKRFEEAENLLSRVIKICENSFGPDDPEVAIALNNQAHLFKCTGRLDKAKPLIMRSLTIEENNRGSEHPYIAIRLNNLAGLLRATNQLEEAVLLVRRALHIDELHSGASHPDVARDLNNLAGLLMDIKSPEALEDAENLIRRALAINKKCLGTNHLNVANDLYILGKLLHITGRLAEAEPLMRERLVILLFFSAQNGYHHPQLATASEDYFNLLLEMGHAESDIKQTFFPLLESYGLKPKD
jgi:tetratricopeptide (TPR) repeat protein